MWGGGCDSAACALPDFGLNQSLLGTKICFKDKFSLNTWGGFPLSLGFFAGGSLTGILWCPGLEWGKDPHPMVGVCVGVPEVTPDLVIAMAGIYQGNHLSEAGRCQGLGGFPCSGRVNSAPCAAARAGMLIGQIKPPMGSCVCLYQAALLSQTCNTDDKVQPRVTVGSWQQKRQVAKLGAVWFCSQPGVLLFDLSCPSIQPAPPTLWIYKASQANVSQGSRMLCPGPGPWQGDCCSRQSMVFYSASPPPSAGASSDAREECPCDVRLELGWPWHPCAEDPDSGQGRVALDHPVQPLWHRKC